MLWCQKKNYHCLHLETKHFPRRGKICASATLGFSSSVRWLVAEVTTRLEANRGRRLCRCRRESVSRRFAGAPSWLPTASWRVKIWFRRRRGGMRESLKLNVEDFLWVVRKDMYTVNGLFFPSSEHKDELSQFFPSIYRVQRALKIYIPRRRRLRAPASRRRLSYPPLLQHPRWRWGPRVSERWCDIWN